MAIPARAPKTCKPATEGYRYTFVGSNAQPKPKPFHFATECLACTSALWSWCIGKTPSSTCERDFEMNDGGASDEEIL